MLASSGKGDGGNDGVVAAAEAAQEAIVQYESKLASFSHNLELCFTEFDNDHESLNMLRNEISDAAHLYKNCHLKAGIRLLEDVDMWVGNYVDLTQDEFCDAELLGAICEQAGQYAGRAEMVSIVHHELYTDIKNLQNKARREHQQVLLEHEHASRNATKLERKATKHEKRSDVAAVACTVGVGLAFVTGGASLLLSGLAIAYGVHHDEKKDLASASASAAHRNAINAENAAEIIMGPLSNSLYDLTAAIVNASTFFQHISNEIKQYEKMANSANRATQQQAMAQVRLHYLRMKKVAKRLSNTCKGFLARVPQFESDLNRLAKYSKTNKSSYIKSWLESKAAQLKQDHANSRDQKAKHWLESMATASNALAQPGCNLWE